MIEISIYTTLYNFDKLVISSSSNNIKNIKLNIINFFEKYLISNNENIESLIILSKEKLKNLKLKKIIINLINNILSNKNKNIKNFNSQNILSKIQKITIKNINLKSVPEFILKCSNLVNLNLPNNAIINIPNNLPNSIINLNLSNNYITEVKILPNNILTLVLDNNKIKNFDINFNSKKYKYKLNSLSLMNNNLHSFRFCVENNSLKYLTLSFNKNLSSNLFYLGKQIKYLDIDYTNIRHVNNLSNGLYLIDNIDYLLGKKEYRSPSEQDFKLIRTDNKKFYKEYKYNCNIPLFIENCIR